MNTPVLPAYSAYRLSDRKGRIFFHFAAPPALGTQVQYTRNRLVTLVAIEPHVRSDGLKSWVLTWQSEDGEIGTTGLRSRHWSRIKAQEVHLK